MTVVPAASPYVHQTVPYLPPATPVELSDDETAVVLALASRLSATQPHMMASDAYYNGLQTLYDLGVTIPAQLSRVRTVVDWPRICCDPLVQMAVVDGFRLPSATDVDSELEELWQASNMDAEAPLCYLDSLVFGRGYQIVGTDDDGDPLITVESPLNLAVSWDPRKKATRAAYQVYEADGERHAALYLPNVTIQMLVDESGKWVVTDRDQHNLGEVPVVRFANRQRAADREGRSEITPAVRNTTDSACRSLLGMEIAREFYSVPHRYVLGANEDDFMNSDGTPKTALQMTLSKFIAFERDENGDLPTVGQFQAFDPSVFTKIIDKHAQLMASYTQFSPDHFGHSASANPASADAIRVAKSGEVARGKQVQHQFSDPQETVMRLAWRIANGGREIPAAMKRLVTDWKESGPETPAATTDALVKQSAEGMVPATSDVVLKRLGYNSVERARLKQDRETDHAQSTLDELANSLAARADRSAARVENQAAGETPPAGPPNA